MANLAVAARPRDWPLVLTEHAGELFIGEGACGSDARFEEALAAKRQTNLQHFVCGLQEGLRDRGIAATLAIPIRPLTRVKDVRRDGLGLASTQ